MASGQQPPTDRLHLHVHLAAKKVSQAMEHIMLRPQRNALQFLNLSLPTCESHAQLLPGIDCWDCGNVCSAEGHIALEALCKATHATCIAVRDLVLAGDVCEVSRHAAPHRHPLLGIPHSLILLPFINRSVAQVLNPCMPIILIYESISPIRSFLSTSLIEHMYCTGRGLCAAHIWNAHGDGAEGCRCVSTGSSGTG